MKADPIANVVRGIPRADEPNAFKFGEIRDEPIEVYHGCGAVSKTKLDTFRDSPALFKKRFITHELQRERTEALIVGGAIDALALEGPDAFNARYVCVPDDAPKKPTEKQRNAVKKSPATVEAIAFWDKFGADAKGKEILTDRQASLVQRCADALHANKEFARLMQCGKSQVTFRVRGRRFAMQCRPDIWLEDGCDLTDGAPAIVDLKSCAELPADTAESLMRHIGDFGYHRSGYIYPELVAQVKGFRDHYRPPFILALVEKREPHAVLVRVLDSVAIDVGEKEVGVDLQRLEQCLSRDDWPESWDAPMSKISLSPYYIKRALEDSQTNLWG